MKKAISRIDRIILLCRNVERTAGIYSEALGMKVHLQSSQFVELRDSANMAIYLQKATQAAHLNKGYSPIISLKVVDNLEDVYAKMVRSELMPDGDMVTTPQGKLATFLGPEGEMISINNFQDEEQTHQDTEQAGEEDEIKRILSKIKI